MTGLWPRVSGCFTLLVLCLFSAGSALHAEEVPIERVFAAVPFAQWVKQGPVTAVPWKVRIRSYGLALQQRLVASIDIELAGRDLLKRPAGDRIVVLVQGTDANGEQFRDHTPDHLDPAPERE